MNPKLRFLGRGAPQPDGWAEKRGVASVINGGGELADLQGAMKTKIDLLYSVNYYCRWPSIIFVGPYVTNLSFKPLARPSPAAVEGGWADHRGLSLASLWFFLMHRL